jgi:hypothetical protein
MEGCGRPPNSASCCHAGPPHNSGEPGVVPCAAAWGRSDFIIRPHERISSSAPDASNVSVVGRRLAVVGSVFLAVIQTHLATLLLVKYRWKRSMRWGRWRMRCYA